MPLAHQSLYNSLQNHACYNVPPLSCIQNEDVQGVLKGFDAQNYISTCSYTSFSIGLQGKVHGQYQSIRPMSFSKASVACLMRRGLAPMHGLLLFVLGGRTNGSSSVHVVSQVSISVLPRLVANPICSCRPPVCLSQHQHTYKTYKFDMRPLNPCQAHCQL